MRTREMQIGYLQIGYLQIGAKQIGRAIGRSLCYRRNLAGDFRSLAVRRFCPLAFLPRYSLPPRNGLQADTIHALGILAC